MVSPHVSAMSAASSAVRRMRGEAVTYVRGATELEITGAIRGFTAWDRTAPFNGVRVGDRSLDFLIEAAQLVSGGTQWEPQRGDEIRTENGTVYRVMPFGPDSQLWQEHTDDVWRIHTKERG